MSTKQQKDNVSINISGNISFEDKEKLQANTSKQKDTMKEPEKSDDKEIDLLKVTVSLFQVLSSGIKNLIAFVWHIIKTLILSGVRFIQIVFSVWKIIAAFLIIGLALTYYAYNKAEPYYISDGYGISRIAKSQEIIQIINSVSIPDDNSSVARKNDLNLSPKVYNSVQSIHASWLIDTNGDGISDVVDYNNDYQFNKEEDSLAYRMMDRFNVRLVLKDQTVTPQVEEALIAYLSNNPYIKGLNASRLSIIAGELETYNAQAVVLDSLQDREYFANKKNNSVQIYKMGEYELIGKEEEKDQRLYHDQIIELKKEVTVKKTALDYNADPVLFVGSFTNVASRTNSLMYYLKRYAMILIPIGIIVFVVLRRRELTEIFEAEKWIKK